MNFYIELDLCVFHSNITLHYTISLLEEANRRWELVLDDSVHRVMLLLCLTAEADDRESESDDDTDAERDLDEEGGDLGTEECDKLDEQMWGSDDEEPVKV